MLKPSNPYTVQSNCNTCPTTNFSCFVDSLPTLLRRSLGLTGMWSVAFTRMHISILPTPDLTCPVKLQTSCSPSSSTRLIASRRRRLKCPKALKQPKASPRTRHSLVEGSVFHRNNPSNRSQRGVSGLGPTAQKTFGS